MITSAKKTQVVAFDHASGYKKCADPTGNWSTACGKNDRGILRGYAYPPNPMSVTRTDSTQPVNSLALLNALCRNRAEFPGMGMRLKLPRDCEAHVVKTPSRDPQLVYSRKKGGLNRD